MFCPGCKAEFREGITHCPDCDLDLVENLPEDKKQKPMNIEKDSDYEVVSLMAIHDKVQAELIMNLLRNNGISCFKKAKTAGGYLELYAGNSIYGEEIYVHKQDYADAYSLCQELLLEEDTLTEEDEEFDKQVAKMHEKRKQYNKSISILCIIILVLGFSVTMITWIADMFF